MENNQNIIDFFKDLISQNKFSESKNNPFHKVLSSINDLFFVFDKEQHFVFVNQPNNKNLIIKYKDFIRKELKGKIIDLEEKMKHLQ